MVDHDFGFLSRTYSNDQGHLGIVERVQVKVCSDGVSATENISCDIRVVGPYHSVSGWLNVKGGFRIHDGDFRDLS